MIPQLDQLALSGKRLFIRLDLNVPLAEGGRIADDSRIQASLPTIHYCLEQGGRLILASHLGRPKGRPLPEYSLLPVAERLSELLNLEVLFPEDCVGSVVKRLASDLKEGQILLLENLRFHPGEEANDSSFAEKLAQLGEVYINDAFGTLHRAHASTVGMVGLMPERAAGLLVAKELQVLEHLVTEPERPFWAILGGAKVSDKLGVLDNLIKKVDGIIIGGAMAYTFLKAQGHQVGASLVEEGKVHQAAKILERAKFRDIPFLLPVDHVIGQRLEGQTPFETTSGPEIPESWLGLDIGPKSLELFKENLEPAKTVFWNGPLGAFEIPPFEQGTLGIARCLAGLSAQTVIGGGDSLAAVKAAGVADQMSHLSTGGGASLEFLEGKELPGLKALNQ